MTQNNNNNNTNNKSEFRLKNVCCMLEFHKSLHIMYLKCVFFFCFKILLLSLVSFFDVMLSNVICVNGSMKGVRVYALAFLCRYSIIYIIKCMCVDIVFCLLSFGYVYKNNIQTRKKKREIKQK